MKYSLLSLICFIITLFGLTYLYFYHVIILSNNSVKPNKYGKVIKYLPVTGNKDVMMKPYNISLNLVKATDVIKTTTIPIAEAIKVTDNFFHVNFTISTTIGIGNVIVKVRNDWAPLGSQRFRELIEASYYNEARFFRVIKV